MIRGVRELRFNYTVNEKCKVLIKEKLHALYESFNSVTTVKKQGCCDGLVSLYVHRVYEMCTKFGGTSV